MSKAHQTHDVLKKIILFLYTVLMLFLLFKRTPGNADGLYWEQLRQRVNLSPFLTLRTFYSALIHGGLTQKRLAVINLVGNVIMFIPFGYLLPNLYHEFRPYLRFFIKSLALICLVELLQLFTLLGVMDVDDVILNMLGFSLGYCIHKIHTSCKKRR